MSSKKEREKINNLEDIIRYMVIDFGIIKGKTPNTRSQKFVKEFLNKEEISDGIMLKLIHESVKNSEARDEINIAK